jgi:aspartate/methionine/tyrosine aminotransferase
MKIEDFSLERWLLNPSRFDLASAGITKLRLGDLTNSIDPDMLMAYGVTNGSLSIRKAVAERYDANVSPENVLISTGAAEANFLVLYRLLEKEDEFVTFLPTYMQCVGIARSLGAQVRIVPLREELNFKPDINELRKVVTKRTKLIFLVNPNNPTGSILSAEEMQEICEIASQVDAWVLCDGALRGLEVEGQVSSTPVEFYRKGIATGSLSKIGLTGIRIGWMVAPKDLVDLCWSMKDYTTLSHSGIGEYLGAIALQSGNMARFFQRARTVIKEHLGILSKWVAENHGLIEWSPPKAGHTTFLKYNLEVDSVELCKRLLAEESVLLGPGDYFGSPRHLRLRYSCDRNVLMEGLTRFGAFLRRVSGP